MKASTTTSLRSCPAKTAKCGGDRFLINPYGVHWSEMTASALCLCNEEGEVLEGGEKVENTAFYIHSRIHVNVPSAKVVLHTHQPYSTAITLLEGGRLEMCEQNALMFDDRIAYDDDYDGLALDNDEGDRLASAMGNRSIAFLASHGIVVSGETVGEAFTDLFYLERAAPVPDDREGDRRQVAEDFGQGAGFGAPAVRRGTAEARRPAFRGPETHPGPRRAGIPAVRPGR